MITVREGAGKGGGEEVGTDVVGDKDIVEEELEDMCDGVAGMTSTEVEGEGTGATASKGGAWDRMGTFSIVHSSAVDEDEGAVLSHKVT